MTGPLNLFDNLSVQKLQFINRFPPLALHLFQFQLHSFFYKNVVFPAQAEYSYFSADFENEKIFVYYC